MTQNSDEPVSTKHAEEDGEKERSVEVVTIGPIALLIPGNQHYLADESIFLSNLVKVSLQELAHWMPGKAWQVTGALPSPSTNLHLQQGVTVPPQY